jgi:hypothetical protein
MERTDNPFRAPAARIAVTQPAEDGDLLTDPRLVSAGDAVGWLRAGLELFKQAPGTWIAILIVFMVITVGLSFIPILGVLTGLLLPVFTGGIMLGCEALEREGELAVSDLFEGFKRQTTNLLLVGAINLVASIALMVIVGIGAAGAVGASMFFASEGSGAALGFGAVLGVVLLLIVVMLLAAPLTMAMWFAPALVAIHGVSPVEALKRSFFGGVRNWLPLLAYGVVLILLTLAAALPLLLGFLVLVPVVWASMYVGYRDIFVR